MSKDSKGNWITAYLLTDDDLLVDVSLNASGSYDPDGDSITFAWSPAQLFDNPTSATPIAVVGPGITTVTLTVTDEFGLSVTKEVKIIVSSPDLAGLSGDSPNVSLNGISADWAEYDSYTGELIVKFDRAQVSQTVSVGPDRPMVISGAVEGETTIDVISSSSRGKSQF